MEHHNKRPTTAPKYKLIPIPPGQKVEIGARMSGTAICRVLENGKVISETAPTKNLILYPGIEDRLSNDGNWRAMLANCRAGTDTTANFTAPDGTFARAGVNVTRSTGTGVFAAGDVGKVIKFASGEEAYITTFNSTTSVDTRETGTIAAATIVLWNTQQTALVAEVADHDSLDGGASSNTETHDTGAGTTAIKRTYNFAVEVGAVSYTEIGISRLVASDLLSRIVLGSAVNVGIGQQLQVVYTLTMAMTGDFIASTAVAPTITGWPFPYTITDITHGGASFDITVDDNHHYTAGDEITIANALPEKDSISGITSDVSEFIVTTSTAHGFSGADSIEIEGASPGSYNGTWTVASVDSTTVFRVTTGINPGAGSGGTTRFATPGTYFNGTWTIASLPTATTIRVTDATISTGVPAGEGDLEGTLAGDAIFQGLEPFTDGTASTTGSILDPISAAARSLEVETSGSLTLAGMGTNMPNGDDTATRDETKTNDLADHSYTWEGTFDIDEANSTDIDGFLFQGGGGSNHVGLIVKFDQKQRKDTGFILQWGYKVTFRPDLA